MMNHSLTLLKAFLATISSNQKKGCYELAGLELSFFSCSLLNRREGHDCHFVSHDVEATAANSGAHERQSTGMQGARSPTTSRFYL